MANEKLKAYKPIRAVLVGCGAVSTLYYAPALQSLEKAGVLNVVGLFDPNDESVTRLHGTFSNASRIESLSQICRRSAELAIIASPPRYHAEQTIQLLEIGLSVLCEKPMALNVVESEAMIKVAAATGRLLAIGLFRRFFPATQTIRDILSNGMIGEPVSFYFCEGSDFNWPVASAGYFRKPEAGGGVLLDIGVHALDLLSWWFGGPEQVLYEDDAMGGVEANCRIRVRFSGGLAGEIRLSRDSSLPNHYLIDGTKGRLGWEVNEADKIQLTVNSSPYTLNAQLYEGDRNQAALHEAADFHQCFVDQLRNVIAAVHGQERPRVSGADGLQSIKLIEYCYRHRTLLAMPWLNDAENRRAKELAAVR